MPNFDFTAFTEALIAAGERTFPAMRANHPGEHFYCMAFYTSGEFAYVVPTAMTEEGLDATVAVYLATHAASENPEKLRRRLRWMPCDSPLHLEGEVHFEDAQPLVSEVCEALLAIESERAADRFADQVGDALCNALEELDRRGVFGRDLERRRVFVSVMMGDQDDSILEYGQRLNPQKTFERFRDEWKTAWAE
ncbi:MAG: DUF4303 domain-containing protein [Sandaracinaceae bacterium]|nr:DUF4303 domain-containing protein [Sandaracinaceae bacterium]